MSPRMFSALLAVLVLAPNLARADIPEILACADQADAKVRLACYDTAAAKLKAQLAQAETRKATLFGFTLPFTDSEQGGADSATPTLAPKEVNQVTATISTTTKDMAGHLIITLDNGQAWRLDEYRTVPHLSVKGTPVAIIRNAFGGFYMGIDGRNTELSVSRIK